MRQIIVYDSAGVSYNLDIDDTTAIGIDYQAYDFKEPHKRKVTISNTFSIPATIANLKTFGYPGNVHTASTRMYERWYVDYYIDNIQFINRSRIRLESVDLETGRIELFIFEKSDIWDELKDLKWPDFLTEFMVWMRDEKGLPYTTGPGGGGEYFSGNMPQFLGQYANPGEGLVLPNAFGPLANYQRRGETFNVENEWSPMMIWQAISLYYYDVSPDNPDEEFFCEGGHFCIYARTIFEFLEYKYSVNFYSSGGGFAGNIWDDIIAGATYVPARDVCVETNDGTDWTFTLRNDRWTGYFEPFHDAVDKADKSLFDFVLAFFHHFNCVIEGSGTGDVLDTYKIRRFDDILTLGRVIDWSGLAKKPKFKPSISGYGQSSVIKFASVYPTGSAEANAKTIVSQNKGMDLKVDLFDIDAYVPAVSRLLSFPMLNTEESFETFVFMVNDTTPTFVATYVSCFNRTNNIEFRDFVNLYPAQLVSLTTEYAAISSALEYPVFYEVEKWLSLFDMMSFNHFNLYYFKELNGSFYVNKISGFNPEKSKQPTKIELIKMSDKAPEPVYNANFWVDDIQDNFVDGTNDPNI